MSQEDCDDESMNPLPKTPKSTKRVAAAIVANSSKRTKNSSPTRVIKSEDDPDSRTRGTRASEPEPPNPETQLLRQPKLGGVFPENSGACPQQEAPIFKSGVAPRASGALGAHNPREATKDTPKPPGAHISRAVPIKTEFGANDAYTPQIKFLEAIRFLIVPLDMHSFTPLKAKIDKMLLESSNKKIPNNEIVLAMETLVTKITNNSVPIRLRIVKSVSLIQFLCYLKSAILNSKLEGLEVLMEKVKERINEPASKDKNIPVEKVVSVLQHTLDGI